MPRLLINEGGQAQVFELLDDEVTLGRGASNSVQVADEHASKHHAVIRRVASRVKLVDLESKNGTRVNGEFKNQRWLEHGDSITIGAAVFTFDAADAVATRGGARAPAVARAAATGAAAPPAPRTTSRGGGRTGVRRERRRDDEDGEEEAERPPPPSSTATVVLAVAGGLAVLGLVILLISHAGGGRPSNATVLAEAKRMSNTDVKAAYEYLKRESDPSDEDGYVSVKEELVKWEKVLATQRMMVDEGQAQKVIAKIEFDRIEQHKNGFTDQALGERLIEFDKQFQGSSAASSLRRNNFPPNLKLWRLLVRAEGKQPNAEAIRVARSIWTDENDRAGAMAFLKAHADPNAEGYAEVETLLASWAKIR